MSSGSPSADICNVYMYLNRKVHSGFIHLHFHILFFVNSLKNTPGLQELYFPTPGARENFGRALVFLITVFPREHVNSVLKKLLQSKSDITCHQLRVDVAVLTHWPAKR